MSFGDRNIYQRARESAGLTQERAAELLDISVESLRAYELDKRYPPERVAATMVEVYNMQVLAYQHLKHSSEIARRCLPEVCEIDLPTAILRLYKEVNDFEKRRDELVDIGCDGVIDAEEMPRFIKIIQGLDDLMAAVLALKLKIRE